MIYRTLLATAFLALLAHSDPVSIEVYIRCDPSIPFWQGELAVFEHDVEKSDLFKTRNFTTKSLDKWFMFEPFYPGWDIGFNSEIGYTLRHNCTHSGKFLCLEPPPVEVSQFGRQVVDFYIRAFENGEDHCHTTVFEEEQPGNKNFV